MEANRADYYTLLRVPGIGPKSARRIVQARRMGQTEFSGSEKGRCCTETGGSILLRVRGVRLYPLKLHEDFILRSLLSAQSPEAEVDRQRRSHTASFLLFEREETAFMKYHKGGRCYAPFFLV